MNANVIFLVWLGGMVTGAVTMVGVAELLTGRTVFKWRAIDWSMREARMLGLTRVIQGLAGGAYVLLFGLTFANIVPQFWVGNYWGLFTSAPLAVAWVGTLAFQVVLVALHKADRSTSSP